MHYRIQVILAGSSPMYLVFIVLSLLFPNMLGMLFSFDHFYFRKNTSRRKVMGSASAKSNEPSTILLVMAFHRWQASL